MANTTSALLPVDVEAQSSTASSHRQVNTLAPPTQQQQQPQLNTRYVSPGQQQPPLLTPNSNTLLNSNHLRQ